MRILQKSLDIIFLIIAFLFGGIVTNAQTQTISVSVNRAKVERGQTVEIAVKTADGKSPQASILKPSIGGENLSLQKTENGIYRATVKINKDAPAGLYIAHVWTGERENPSAVGKASFRVGNIVADYFVFNYLDKQKPAEDLDNYLKSFRAVGGNFLVAHNLIIPNGAFYPSSVAKTDVKKRGAENDFVELILNRADEEGFAVLLSVSWDVTQNSSYKDRMKEIKSIISELYALYRHHPSLAGFYSWQEGSGTYYAPFVREFSEYVKSLDKGLLTACAPHIDDPLLASYLSVIEELDMMIYQSAVMASYRPDNRKKYPLRRVRDFSGLGAGAKRLQNKITLTHVELFAYMEKLQSKDFATASPQDIYGQILSAATVTDTDGIALFTYQAHIYEPLKKFKQVEKSRQAVADGLKAYQLITSKISKNRNSLALYIPYSDFVVERWSNYFLLALDAFRTLGVPVDILPYAPRMDESVYPYYPIHHNEEVLERLLKEKTVLVLVNVSGFQQTDSDLIKAFVERGGVIVAFGGQIPTGRTYERKELFGGEELPEKTHSQIIVKNAIGKRVPKNKRISFAPESLSSWTANGASVIAEFEDGSAAILVNKFGKGTIVTALPDAEFAAQNLPELVRDALDYALAASGNKPLIDIIGTNEKFDLAITYTENGFNVALVNHNAFAREIIIKSPAKNFVCSTQMDNFSSKNAELKLNLPGGEFKILECRFDRNQ
ncbi:MAG: DUF4434 domain-containing protein [Pyrinomonadaceae bacterium]